MNIEKKGENVTTIQIITIQLMKRIIDSNVDYYYTI